MTSAACRSIRAPPACWRRTRSTTWSQAGYPLFARCYRDGVNRDSSLDGTVRLHFVVGSGGAVSEVSDRGSDLTDRQVVDCIAEGFYALRFPEPQHGTVQVLYRLGFEVG